MGRTRAAIGYFVSAAVGETNQPAKTGNRTRNRRSILQSGLMTVNPSPATWSDGDGHLARRLRTARARQTAGLSYRDTETSLLDD